jgi:hypothetical protein
MCGHTITSRIRNRPCKQFPQYPLILDESNSNHSKNVKNESIILQGINIRLDFILEITNCERAVKDEKELEKLPPNLSPVSP